MVRPIYKSDQKVMQLVDFRAVSWIWEEDRNKKKMKKQQPPPLQKKKMKKKAVIKRPYSINHNDYISRFPDDILLTILFLLPLKDAARTGLLSRRWRYLWTLGRPTLDFDASRALSEIYHSRNRASLLPVEKPKSVNESLKRFHSSATFPDSDWASMLGVEKRKFVNSVNRALKQYRGSSVDELSICFDVESYKSDLDSWIHFAIQKRVKRFRLDLTSISSNSKPYGDYSFPSHLLCPSSFDSLTALHLIYVAVTGQVIEHFLSNSPFLEVLHLELSSCLGNLKILGSKLKLKYLHLKWNHIQSLEISAPNLASFEYRGSKISMSIKDVPCLKELYLWGPGSGNMLKSNFSGYLSQLGNLTYQLESSSSMDWEHFSELVKLNNLKMMTLSWMALSLESCPLYRSFPLLEASPSLHKLSLFMSGNGDQGLKCICLSIQGNQTPKCKLVSRPKHRCLKVVEFVGFVGLKYDLELILYFVEVAEVLEKIIINPRKPRFWGSPLMSNQGSLELEAARSRAQKMRSQLPPQIKLEIL